MAYSILQPEGKRYFGWNKMKKHFGIFALLVIFVFFSSSSIADEKTTKVIKGSVHYTVETARKAAFEGLDLKLDKSIFEPYLYDENNKENRAAIKANKQIKGRNLMSFIMAKGLVKGYAIVYDDKPQYVFYYSNGGYLIAIDNDTHYESEQYPYKIGKYSSITGNLISIGFYVSDDEQYVYSKTGKLKAHWIGAIGYNEAGRPIAKREYTDILEP